MPVVTLVSAKGSPGVTTAAAALAAAATADTAALLVELDPAGGDLQILTGVAEDPGVVGAAGELRRDVSPAAIGRHTTVAPPGLPALLAPTAGTMAASVIGSVLDRWGPALRQHGGTVVVDAGRWDATQITARRAGVGDVVAVVCRPTLAGVQHTRQMVDRLRDVARRPVVAVVVGSRPYAPAEVAAELDVPLAGAIAWDPRGASTLWAKGITRSWGRTWLAASAATTLNGLLHVVLGPSLAAPAAAADAGPPPSPAAPAPPSSHTADAPGPRSPGTAKDRTGAPARTQATPDDARARPAHRAGQRRTAPPPPPPPPDDARHTPAPRGPVPPPPPPFDAGRRGSAGRVGVTGSGATGPRPPVPPPPTGPATPTAPAAPTAPIAGPVTAAAGRPNGEQQRGAGDRRPGVPVSPVVVDQ